MRDNEYDIYEDEDLDEFFRDMINEAGYKTMREASAAGILNYRDGFYLSDGVWLMPNGECVIEKW